MPNGQGRRQWKARLIVSLAMLAFAAVGLIIMDLHPKGYWLYSQVMAVSYAGMSIWLFWYLHRGEQSVSGSTIWHQLLHWVGLLLAVYITSIFVSTGVMASVQAGLMTLTLLALTIFLAGVYTDSSFLLIGVALAVFAAGAALIQAYLSALMIPIFILTALVIFIMVHRDKKQPKETPR